MAGLSGIILCPEHVLRHQFQSSAGQKDLGKTGSGTHAKNAIEKKSVGMIVLPVFPEPAARYFFSARFRQCSQMTTSRMAIRVAQDAE